MGHTRAPVCWLGLSKAPALPLEAGISVAIVGDGHRLAPRPAVPREPPPTPRWPTAADAPPPPLRFPGFPSGGARLLVPMGLTVAVPSPHHRPRLADSGIQHKVAEPEHHLLLAGAAEEGANKDPTKVLGQPKMFFFAMNTCLASSISSPRHNLRELRQVPKHQSTKAPKQAC